MRSAGLFLLDLLAPFLPPLPASLPPCACAPLARRPGLVRCADAQCCSLRPRRAVPLLYSVMRKMYSLVYTNLNLSGKPFPAWGPLPVRTRRGAKDGGDRGGRDKADWERGQLQASAEWCRHRGPPALPVFLQNGVCVGGGEEVEMHAWR